MTGFTLKLIAILSMTIDHVGFLFFPNLPWLRVVGRLAFPIFAYMAAEGLRYTHDRRRYLLRLLLWALLSEVPFDLMCHGVAFSPLSQNVCFTLAAGVGCVCLLENPSAKNNLFVCVILAATLLCNTDYSFVGVLSVVIMYRFSTKDQAMRGVLLACLLHTCAFGLQQIFSLLAAIPIYFYRGRQGIRMKYFFYIFYPLHMLLLWMIYTHFQWITI